MTTENEFQTVTMAEIYASQGLYEKAAEVYKYLLKQEPHRQDLALALSEVEKQQFERKGEVDGDLATLFSQWIELIFMYKRLQFLKHIKSRL